TDIFPDLESLLAPIAGESAAGVDLDGTLELSALELACAEPEGAVVPGVDRSDTRDWRGIRDQTRALLARSKDLRLAVPLARALLLIDGLPGLCAGVRFLCELTERHWDVLHPALDAEDRDAVRRLNAIQELASGPFLAQLRLAPMFGSDRAARMTANDLLLATSHPLGKPELSRAASHIVFGVLDALGSDALQEHLDLLRDTRDRLLALTKFVFDKTGAALRIGAIARVDANGPAGLLDALHQSLADEVARLAKRPVPKAAANAESTERPPHESSTGDITRREDVIRTIERICAYYVRVEPSSPVPLLLQRAKRLVTMDFIEIVRDLADQGLAQLGNVAGIAIAGVGGAESEEED
ncbi:MAG TPA: type VI secretion system ImpA family N-terminal domain-containing protein, partial [Polyangiaceae bacterium]|nr:type VI secretion system ImpA family N-terminal domain-containing protein [Polyangiaceae bacterium]